MSSVFERRQDNTRREYQSITAKVIPPFLEEVHSTGQDNTINFRPRLGVMVDDHSKPNELFKESYNLARMEERYPNECHLPAYRKATCDRFFLSSLPWWYRAKEANKTAVSVVNVRTRMHL